MELEKLQKRIGFTFQNKGLLEEALTHRSYLNENPSWAPGNNERLEFLGDAVLELVITEELFRKFPRKEEGTLTVLRAALVNSKSLSEVAKDLGLDKELLLSRGEAKDAKGKGRETISANAVEALIGAIYMDGGYEKAKLFIEHFILPKLEAVAKDGGKDAKSLVQEYAQAELKITPIYEVVEETGPAHSRHFRVGLYFDKEFKAEGAGTSKQEAEVDAAERFLASLAK
ncbi:MAG: ribonuclease III [bacterium]|nr:ribonuclease III [bacterium]MDZ4231494.1 ribonuclease III [Patescibacteria group bacterium]